MKNTPLLRVVQNDERPKKTEGNGACKYCIHLRNDILYGKYKICTVFNTYSSDLRKTKTDQFNRIYLVDCREYREKPFAIPRYGFRGTMINLFGKILYPFIVWLKK